MTRSSLVIHSGGQTGVDRATLDAALAEGFRIGGWCPQGRRAEDGPIPPRYPLQETPTPDYDERTRWNVRDTDATLILTRGTPSGGTATTIEAAHTLEKPLYVIDLDESTDVEPAAAWVRANDVAVLNVAGPRESSAPGIYEEARAFVTALLRALGGELATAGTGSGA